MFLSRNMKNDEYPCKPQFYYIKWGLRGLKLYRRVSVMHYFQVYIVFSGHMTCIQRCINVDATSCWCDVASTLRAHWVICCVFSLYPRHTELVLTAFRKLLPNVLKLSLNWVDVVATFYNLFTNFLDGLERDGCSRTLSLLKIFCRPSRPVIRRSDNVFKTRWTHYKWNCRTSILLGTWCDVVQSGINWK